MPPDVTVIAEVVSAVDHKNPVPPDAERVKELPWQKVVGPLGVIRAVGNGLTVIILLSVFVQPFALVTVTVYVPPEVTVIA